MNCTKLHKTMAGAAAGSGTLTAGTPAQSLAYQQSADLNDFEEMVALIELGAFSATPAGEKLTVEMQQSPDNQAANFAKPAPLERELKRVYGPVANGGGGEALENQTLVFHFAPGNYKDLMRLNVQVDTTAGTETVPYSVRFVGAEPREFPAVQIPAAAVVTPS